MAVGRGQEIAMGWSAVGGLGVVVAWGEGVGAGAVVLRKERTLWDS